MTKRLLTRVVGAISLAAYTLSCTIYTTENTVVPIVATVIAAVCGALICPEVVKYIKNLSKEKGDIAFAIVLFFFSVYSANGYMDILQGPIFGIPKVIMAILIIPSVFLMYLCAERFLLDLIRDLFSDTSKTEKYEYLMISVGISLLVLWCYLKNAKWFYGFDLIYSTDSSSVLDFFYLSPTVRTIRHPMIQALLYPIGLLACVVRQFVTPSLLYGIDLPYVIALVHIQIILLIGMMLRKITNDRRIFRLYAACFAPLSMCVCFDKYPLLVFLLVAYVYYSLKGNCKKAAVLLGAAAGGWITSSAMGVAELLEKRTVSEKIKRIVLIIVGSVLGVICTGGLLLLFNVEEIFQMADYGGKASLGTGIRSFLNMIAGTVVPLDTLYTERIVWEHVETVVPALAYVIAVLIIIGLLDHLRDRFTLYEVIWLSFSVFMFVVCRWNVGESPLFSLYFSWAIVPAMLAGLRRVCAIVGWDDDMAADIATIGIALLNLTQIVSMTSFLCL